MQERRTSQRFRANVKVRWETLKMEGRGDVCDVSSTGCFVLTGGEVTRGELARLELMLPGEVTTLWGNVVYDISEMGFAVRFVFGTEADQQIVDRVINNVQ
ncbi:MAG: PilZ domain-containing protein [Pyrinomonadaceae bacterium]